MCRCISRSPRSFQPLFRRWLILGDPSVAVQWSNPLFSSRKFNPHQPLSYMFTDGVIGHDHQSLEFIVKFWLINGMSRNNTCSCNEICILSASSNLESPKHVFNFHSLHGQVCVCVCVGQLWSNNLILYCLSSLLIITGKRQLNAILNSTISILEFIVFPR